MVVDGSNPHDDADLDELAPVLSCAYYRPRKGGRLSWPSSARRQRSVVITSPGIRTRVTRMVAQWFTHYSTIALVQLMRKKEKNSHKET